jgi:hypothetical protein
MSEVFAKSFFEAESLSLLVTLVADIFPLRNLFAALFLGTNKWTSVT